MMLKKIKFGKIAIVIFLTVLIWVWADLALDEELPVPNATITVTNPPDNLWVSFNSEGSVSIDNVVFKGPASKVHEMRRKWNAGLLELDFSLNPEREGMTTAGPRTLNVLDFVKRSDKMKELAGLTVQSCEPKIIDVNVVELIEKSLDIECVDESGLPLEVDSIEPAKVIMFVPADSRLTARVQLTLREIGQARSEPVSKRPYVVLTPDKTIQASLPVQIKMPPEATSLREYPIKGAKLGIISSVNIEGEYKTEVTNYNEVVSPFRILATPEAKKAYESQTFQMILYILDDEATRGPDVQRKKVVYDFPEEFVRRNEIRLNPSQRTAEAQFKLIRLTPTETPSVGGN